MTNSEAKESRTNLITEVHKHRRNSEEESLYSVPHKPIISPKLKVIEIKTY